MSDTDADSRLENQKKKEKKTPKAWDGSKREVDIYQLPKAQDILSPDCRRKK